MRGRSRSSAGGAFCSAAPAMSGGRAPGLRRAERARDWIVTVSVVTVIASVVIVSMG